MNLVCRLLLEKKKIQLLPVQLRPRPQARQRLGRQRSLGYVLGQLELNWNLPGRFGNERSELQPHSSAERPRMRARSLSQIINLVIAHPRATPSRIESSDSTAGT